MLCATDWENMLGRLGRMVRLYPNPSDYATQCNRHRKWRLRPTGPCWRYGAQLRSEERSLSFLALICGLDFSFPSCFVSSMEYMLFAVCQTPFPYQLTRPLLNISCLSTAQRALKQTLPRLKAASLRGNRTLFTPLPSYRDSATGFERLAKALLVSLQTST